MTLRAAFSQPQFEQLDLFDLAGGLVDTPNLARIPTNAAEVLVNAEFRQLGLERRRGRQGPVGDGPLTTHLFGHGALNFELRAATTGQQLIFAQGPAGDGVGSTYLYWNDGGTFEGAVSGANPATSADIIGTDLELGSWVQYANKAFYADGGAVKKFYDGTTHLIHDWGWSGGSLPTPVDLGAAAGGALSDGDAYEVVYTYYSTSLGAESNPSPAVSFTPVAPNLTRNLRAPADPDWTAIWDRIRVYRTFGDGAGEYFFEKEISAGATHDVSNVDFTVSVADDELGSAAVFDNDPPPKIRYLCLFEEQIIAVQADDPTAIVWSKAGNPYAWPTAQKIYIERDAGSDIEGIFVLLGRLFVVKRRSGIFELTPNTEGSFNVAKITGAYGCISYHSVAVAGDFAYWCEVKGFMRFDGQNVVNISDSKIRQTWNRFRQWVMSTAAQFPGKHVPYAIHERKPDQDYVRWLVKDNVEGVVYQLIYDIPRDAWLLHRPGPTTPTASAGIGDRTLFWIQNFHTGERFTLTQDNTGRMFHLDTSFGTTTARWDDAGSDYWFRWRSGTFGDGMFDVKPIYVDIEIEKSFTGQTVTPLTLEFYRNADESDVYTQNFALYDSGTARRRTYRMNLNAKVCKRFAVGIKLDGQDSDLKVLGIRVHFAPEAARLVGA